MQPIVTFPASYILDQMGLKAGMNVAFVFMSIGYGLRLLVNVHLYIFVIGTYFTALGFVFVMNSPTKFASNWFPVSQVICRPCLDCCRQRNSHVRFTRLGCTGSILPCLVPGRNLHKRWDVQSCSLLDLYGRWASSTHAAFLPRATTNTSQVNILPCSYSSQVKKEKYLESLKHLVQNKNYLTLMASVVLVWGVVSAFFATIGWEVGAYGLGSNEVGMVVLWSNACGIFGCIFAGAYIEKTKRYKLTAIVCLLLGIVSLCVFFICLESSTPPAALYALSALVGLFLFPYVTTVVELGTEIAFPIG